MFPAIEQLIRQLSLEISSIDPERRARLDRLTRYIRDRAGHTVGLQFICTHNSRRSHFAQIWAQVLATHFGLENVRTFSGGTETTAFNPRAVAALERAGFRVTKQTEGDNPRYRVSFAQDYPDLLCFSKCFDHPTNPQDHFAAIMTCSDAEENCPFVPGTDLRLSLTYEDPKAADDTPEEARRYDERFRQIGRELYYAFRQLE